MIERLGNVIYWTLTVLAILATYGLWDYRPGVADTRLAAAVVGGVIYLVGSAILYVLTGKMGPWDVSSQQKNARGLFRLWLVLSVLWIGGVGVATWWTFPESELPSYCELPANERSKDFDCSWLARVKRYWSVILDPEAPSWAVEPERGAVLFATLLALIPPAFALALGSALVWAFRGFR